MSGDSSKFSGSFLKRMLRPSSEVNSAQQSKIKQRHPGFSVSGGADFNPPGRTARPVETITSPALKQLSREGFTVYNVKEKEDVYISIQPDSAYFEEDEPRFIKMEPGSFVGGQKVQRMPEVETRPEPVENRVAYTQSADIFANAHRRQPLEEIDFNEIIIKSNDSFDDDLEEPVLFNPGKGSEGLFVSEAAPFVKTETPVAMTSSGASLPVPKETIVEYREVNNYRVEEVPAKPSPVPSRDVHSRPPVRTLDIRKIIRPPVRTAARIPPTASDTMFNIPSEDVRHNSAVEIPTGLYVERHAPISEAESGTANDTDTSSFIKIGMDMEPAVTSAASVSATVFRTESVVSREVYVKQLPPRMDSTPVHVDPVGSETVAEFVVIEIIDPVADILKLTVPELARADEVLADATLHETALPDDGLESYDDKFVFT